MTDSVNSRRAVSGESNGQPGKASGIHKHSSIRPHHPSKASSLRRYQHRTYRIIPGQALMETPEGMDELITARGIRAVCRTSLWLQSAARAASSAGIPSMIQVQDVSTPDGFAAHIPYRRLHSYLSEWIRSVANILSIFRCLVLGRVRRIASWRSRHVPCVSWLT